MAKKIETRSPVQCRSHHQKMTQVYGSRLDIIKHYETKVIPFYKGQFKLWVDDNQKKKEERSV